MRVSVNPIRDVQLTRIGSDRNPVIVVDDVLANAEEVRAHALGSRYRRGGLTAYYPGYVSPSGIAGMSELIEWAAAYVWNEVYALPRLPYVSFDRIQGLTTFAVFAPDMASRYANVHTDGQNWLSMLIYLGGGGGTAFWRDRATGLESYLPPSGGSLAEIERIEEFFDVDMTRRLARGLSLDAPEALARMRATLARRQIAPPFPCASTDEWELLHHVPAKFNRMMICPTWQFHSVAYPDYVPPASLASARLTLNTFVEYPFVTNATLRVADVPGIIE
jgi:hypothetical protein